MSDIVAEAAPDAPQEAGATAPGESNPGQIPDASSAMGSAITELAMPPDSLASSSAVAGAELPNVAPVAVESTTAPDSVSNAAGASITSPIGESSGNRLIGEPGAIGSDVAEPLHMRVAAHLEAIYRMVREHSDALSKLV